MPPARNPPFTITPQILGQVAECCERIGAWRGERETPLPPQLRRENRIRSIQASLAIENNTLSVDQVTAILEGKRVIGLPREIQEVKNAIACYDRISEFNPGSTADFLAAHGILMQALADDAGILRSGGVGVYREGELVHMAPPAERVSELVGDLLDWLGQTDLHPLIASSILHYEIEFIHPFSDGNGRMGRLWQTLSLSRWKPELAFLPVESVIRDHQAEYYRALGEADRRGDAAPFAEFILGAISETLAEQGATDYVGDHVSDYVKFLIQAFQTESEKLTLEDLLGRLRLRHKPSFRKNYLHPALKYSLVEMTDPASPRSPRQRYRLTAEGKRIRGSLSLKPKGQ